MQTQTSNTLHNAIMEAGSKDRPPMLAPDTEVLISKGSPVTRTESQMETYKTVSQDIRDQLNVEVKAVQIILTGIDNDIYSIDGESLKSYYSRFYKMMNELIRNQCDVTNHQVNVQFLLQLQLEWKRIGNVAGARETVGSTVVQKSGIQCYNCKEFRHVARECQKPKQVKDAAYHRKKMLLYQELEVHYMYMAQLQEVSPDAADSGPIFDAEPLQKVSNDDHYNVFAIESAHPEQSKSVPDTYHIEQDAHNVIIDSLDMSYGREEIDQNDDDNDLANEHEVTNLQSDYLKLLEKCECLEKELSKSKTMSKSFESVQKHAINLELKLQQCKEKIKHDKSFKVNQSNDFCKEHEQYVKIQDLKAQFQDKGIIISKLKKLIEKLKGKAVDTKFEKSSVIRKPNAFKSQRPSILGKPTTFLNSLERNDLSKSNSVTQNNVSNDFSKPVTAQTLPPNKKSILKNMNVLAPRMYKLYTESNQARTSQLPQDSRKTNKHVSFSTGIIPTTIVSRPQLKSNPMGDSVMHNNSQGKKQDVEDHRRSVKFSKNKTSVTACNDSLNAKTLNVISVCATCDTCVLNDKHDMCVLNSVAKPLKKTVALESNQKPRNINRKLYERVSKTCSWWYPKFTPSGYKWKLKSDKENVNLNTSMPLRSLVEIVLYIIDSRCSKHMTGNLKLLINFVEKFLGMVKFENDQIAPILGYGDLVQGAVMIKRVYYVEGLNDNLFSVGQFCDADLEVAFRKSTCYIRDLKGNDLLTAASSQAWLWHRRLSHLNFDTINLLSKNDIVVGLPKLKFVKDHLYSSCELGKATRKSFHAKITLSSKRRLQLLRMNLCGPMRVASINGKRYVLVIVDDYSRYTWTHFLRSKDETPQVLINFLRLVQRGLKLKDGENLDKMKEKGDACIFVGYSTQSRAYKVFNKRTRVITESIHVNFDELPHMASDHVSSDPAREFVSKSSAVSTADAPNQRLQHTTPLNNHTTPAPTCHDITLAPTVTSTENMNQAETYAENDQVADNEFIKKNCTPPPPPATVPPLPETFPAKPNLLLTFQSIRSHTSRAATPQIHHNPPPLPPQRQPPPHCHVHHPVTLSTMTIYHVTTSPRCPHHQHHHSNTTTDTTAATFTIHGLWCVSFVNGSKGGVCLVVVDSSGSKGGVCLVLPGQQQ
uniref:CCHC-type domain-containing protein n=1 Tax=Tanacetum cinerariifolium TaxID=118510 RepID=A0A699HK90_TANCI|nr:hypothetical protein [Tanacetum cinerariifolium]